MGVDSRAPVVAIAILVMIVAVSIAGYWILANPA
jgi:hypothetical protein